MSILTATELHRELKRLEVKHVFVDSEPFGLVRISKKEARDSIDSTDRYDVGVEEDCLAIWGTV